MQISVEIYREENKIFVYIGEESSSGCKYEVKSLAEAAEKVSEYIKDSFEDDGADIVWRV